ncbi:hypothetical protein SLEP1_g34853 [Rubroshorea leprosula]|uniref:N-lysine methyltransferase n=2 Tax=Rubroshorea leprosula TaxID=152421 RepID=A0AAV5KLN4_9ROSI|nr:hypothetical protein SLEP1_g34853 [Rubroshorea leprosula]
MDSAAQSLNPSFFGIEDYFAAKSLISSRSFEIDEYHGFGMVPLADLFNHKTGAEDVHFTSVSSDDETDNDADEVNSETDVHVNTVHGEKLTKNFDSDKNESAAAITGDNTDSSHSSECSSVSGDGPMVLEVIMVKDVKAGAEVFNTYGLLGNAALLHRYGFTEPDNPYDILNMDLELVLQWGLSLFSSRYCRGRLSLWRRLDYSGCVSQNSEYFEISSDGEPQIELLVLLYIILLPEDLYRKLDLTTSTAGNTNGCIDMILTKKHNSTQDNSSEMTKDLLLTESVCSSLLELADMRESFYGSSSINDDIEALKRCCPVERKLYHALMLRISERRILEKLRNYVVSAAGRARSPKTANTASRKKRLKKK